MDGVITVARWYFHGRSRVIAQYSTGCTLFQGDDTERGLFVEFHIGAWVVIQKVVHFMIEHLEIDQLQVVTGAAESLRSKGTRDILCHRRLR
jgi:hypothetical protein